MITLACEVFLIQLGIFLEVIAFWRTVEALPAQSSTLQPVDQAQQDQDEEIPDQQTPKPELRPIGNAMVVAPKPKKLLDYYKMDDIPSGIRPGDLARTAKVYYVKNLQGGLD